MNLNLKPLRQEILKPARGQSIIFYPTLLAIFIFSLMDVVEAQSSDQETIIQSSNMISKIERETDPEYIYDYEKTKFVPKTDKTLLIMGQTSERIEEYMDHCMDRPIPGGWAAYWGITEFAGVTKKHKNETGSSQHHQMLVDRFPNTVIQSGLWMVGKWDIARKAKYGEYDHVLRKYCKWAKSVSRPIYLRIGYEFDGIHNELEPSDYVGAYRHIVDLMRKEGVENVAFVWHSYAAAPYKDYSLSAWYPGDEYVDWVGISVFGHAYGGEDFGPHCNNVLVFAKQHKKPVMIAESSPIYGIDSSNDESWNQWFVNFFSFIHQKNIKAISFINEDWTQLRISGISEWKDSRIYNNEQIVNAWFEETNDERYLKQSPQLFEQLSYAK